ncbi:hypothetical protein F2P56_014510 [Juglans regia]|uniref:Uncharacterized protein LOC108996436 n=2 Tax=Juglans regia TaxID=51240 RepID=A0A2I4F8A3_JUGRE|nr:uncharacterized protein LOC108996436 [Juglans regia]KAF5464435.1 hypothetical protein F2P56_014510 [Juglans regia]
MSKVWGLVGWLQFKDMGANKFLVEFQREQDKNKVLLGRPWTFDRYLICMEDVDWTTPPLEIPFSYEFFWVQVHNMPLVSMNKETGMQIGSGIGDVIEIDTDSSGCAWGQYLRMKVRVNLSKPLIRVIKHKEGGCTKLHRGHIKTYKPEYGAWLRATPPKPGSEFTKRYDGGGRGAADPHERLEALEDVSNFGKSNQGPNKGVDPSNQTDVLEDSNRTSPIRKVAIPTSEDPLEPKGKVVNIAQSRGEEYLSESFPKQEIADSIIQVGPEIMVVDKGSEHDSDKKTKGLSPKAHQKKASTVDLDPSLASQVKSLNLFLSSQMKQLTTPKHSTWKRKARAQHMFLRDSDIEDPKMGSGLTSLQGVVEFPLISSVPVKKQKHNESHISVIIDKWGDKKGWICTGFYGDPMTSKRHQSWELLPVLDPGGSNPWLYLGDFNEILHYGEKFRGGSRPLAQMEGFRTVLMECGLHHLGFKGDKFTWCNNREGSQFTKERLDRACANSAWIENFGGFLVTTVAASSSDHRPLVVSLDPEGQNLIRGKRPFRYEASWALREDCHKVVEEAWKRPWMVSNKLELAIEGLKRCKESLRTWSKTSGGSTNKHLHKKIKQLSALQQADKGELQGTIQAVKKEIDQLLKEDDIHWKQRAKKRWLQEGIEILNFPSMCFTEEKKEHNNNSSR